MDDLSKIRGIGAATAKKLVAAGFASFAALGAATTTQLEAADVGGRPSEYGAWIEAAKAKAEKRELSPEELTELVKAWDTARSDLSNAGDAVSAVQAALDVLAPDADRTALDAQLAAAQQTVSEAHAAIDALQPLPDGAKLPGASKAKTAAPTRTAPETKQASAASGTITITVIGPPKGRRRAGYSFGAVPQTISVTADELALIKADASLAVSDGKQPSAAQRSAVQARLSAEDFRFDGTMAITVLGPAKGRRRAGFTFGAEASTVDVTREQLQTILADESLAVTTA